MFVLEITKSYFCLYLIRSMKMSSKFPRFLQFSHVLSVLSYLSAYDHDVRLNLIIIEIISPDENVFRAIIMNCVNILDKPV